MTRNHWINNIFFWQPNTDWFKKISQHRYGCKFLVLINYIIWVYLFYVSYLLIRHETSVFWQLLVATILSELLEKFLKIKSFWKRPMHLKNNAVPDGLLKSWYEKGSFPSGHAMKATFFFMFVSHFPILITPADYSIVAVPLVLIRIVLGLHYPIDVLGGIILGLLIWLPVQFLIFPQFLVDFIGTIFNFVFFIK